MNKPLNPQMLVPDERTFLESLDLDLVRAMTDGASQDEALRLGAGYVSQKFTLTYGATLAHTEIALQDVEAKLSVETAAYTRVSRDLASEPLRIAAAQENGGSDGPAETSAEVPVSKWLLRDKISGVLGAMGTLAIAAATYLGVRATMQEAGLEIFDGTPMLLNTLPLLPVGLSLLIKQAGLVFVEQRHKDRYRLVVVFGGVVAGLAWVPMFSGIYDGVSGVFDPFAEPIPGLGTLFNVTHLMAETLIGAGLYAILDTLLLAKYAPSHKINNPDRAPLVEAKALVEGSVTDLRREQGHLTGQRDALLGLRDVAQTYVETAIRQRMNIEPRQGLL